MPTPHGARPNQGIPSGQQQAPLEGAPKEGVPVLYSAVTAGVFLISLVSNATL